MAIVKKRDKTPSKRVDTREALFKAAIGWAVKKRYTALRELGLNRKIGHKVKGPHLRADLHLMTYNGIIHILEIKSCPADLKNDKKVHLYLPYCHMLTLVCTLETWDWIGQGNYKLPKGMGVMVLDKSGYLKSVKVTKKREMDSELHTESVIARAYKCATYTRYNFRRYRVYLNDGE